MKKTKYAFAAFLMAAAIIFSAGWPAYSAERERDSISVTGSASAEAVPDMAVVSLSMTEYGKSAADARTAIAARIEKLNKLVLSMGIAAKDFKNSGYELAPNYVMEGNKRVQKGYAGTASFAVTVGNLANLGAVIDESAAKCSASVNNVDFGLQKRDQIERRLLSAAVKDAKERASVVAASGGRTVGALISANIGNAGAPSPMRGMMMKNFSGDAVSLAGVQTELSPGVIKVSVSMNLVFELK